MYYNREKNITFYDSDGIVKTFNLTGLDLNYFCLTQRLKKTASLMEMGRKVTRFWVLI